MAKDIPIMSARWQYQPAILLQINWLIGQGKICFQSNTLSTKDQAIKQADAFYGQSSLPKLMQKVDYLKFIKPIPNQDIRRHPFSLLITIR